MRIITTLIILALTLTACESDEATTAASDATSQDASTDTGLLCEQPKRGTVGAPCEFNTQCERFLVCSNLKCDRVSCSTDDDCPAARCDEGLCRWYECGGPINCEMACFTGTCQNSLCK